jgi:RNA polymerase sigma-70 factor (ECF subfamily)
MLLSTARLPARLDDAGHFVPLLEQDRSRWDQSMIREGVALIDAVYAARHLPGAYQIQAAISAIHSGASSAADTDWQQIAALYDKLAEYDASPVVPVNHAVALCYCGNAEAAMARLENVAGALQDYQPYHAAAAHVHEQLGNRAAAIRALRRAEDLAGSPAEKHYLQRRLRTLETGLGTA